MDRRHRRLALSARDEGPQIAQVVVGLELHLVRAAVGLEEERHGVDAEPRQPLGEPEPDQLADLLAHRLRRHVEIGLMPVEAMEVVLPGLVVVRPQTLLGAREDLARRAGPAVSSAQDRT